MSRHTPRPQPTLTRDEWLARAIGRGVLTADEAQALREQRPLCPHHGEPVVMVDERGRRFCAACYGVGRE